MAKQAEQVVAEQAADQQSVASLFVVEDAPESNAKRSRKLDVDLSPYRTVLNTLFSTPAGVKHIPAQYDGNARGKSLSSVKKTFNDALAGMSATDSYDPARIKLVFRVLTPGEKSGTVSVKWAPKID